MILTQIPIKMTTLRDYLLRLAVYVPVAKILQTEVGETCLGQSWHKTDCKKTKTSSSTTARPATGRNAVLLLCAKSAGCRAHARLAMVKDDLFHSHAARSVPHSCVQCCLGVPSISDCVIPEGAFFAWCSEIHIAAGAQHQEAGTCRPVNPMPGIRPVVP